ncbi:MAG TPA: hypothetical protein VFL38_17960 [Humibacillus xanthopallidus]|nr:hypothetical protein [Humibacillus xanthopallidus]
MKSIITAQRRLERTLLTTLAGRLGGRADRGDVPGWVLITIMTAGLVTALWAIAGPQLSSLFSDAISSVKGP